jgi:hypothetical protein
MSYDLYLSYRRDFGVAEARLLQSSLLARGKTSFLDASDMGPGASDRALLEVVTQIPNFIVILSPGSLDRCAEPQDLLRQEISQALQTGSNIIPVMAPGFAFPADLPQDIQALTLHRGVAYSPRSFETMFAEILMAMGPAQPLKLYFQQAAALVAAAPPSASVAAAPPVWQAPIPPPIPRASASFNWLLAGLLFLATLLPTVVSTIFGPSSMARFLGYGFVLSIVIAVVTTIVSQQVRNPFLIAALCGLNEVVTTFFLGALFFNSFRMYAVGLTAFLYGAMIPGSVAVARIPRVPRWTLLVAPVAGASIFTVFAVVAGVPGFQSISVILTRPLTALLAGAAFFFGVRRDEMSA